MVHIRTATLEDVVILAQLNAHVQSIHVAARPKLFKATMDTEALAAHYLKLLADMHYRAFIAEVDQIPAGYILCILREVPENLFTYAQRLVHIDQISVNPAYKRHGCGTALIEAAMELARNEDMQRVSLDVWNFNQVAQAFFQQQGFQAFVLRMDQWLGDK